MAFLSFTINLNPIEVWIKPSLILWIWMWSVASTPFYYGTYRSYGTGDTVISTAHANGGPNTPGSKWQVECLDGEAVISIQDQVFDFGMIASVWCKFMFPYKTAHNGVYPYYPLCHVRNYKNQFFCYDPGNHTVTSNSFVTGFWDDDAAFWVYRAKIDDNNLYKCCKTPPGYYIDYVSCYYQLTHDEFWEYYDSQFYLMMCATGYVYTGISKKKSPIHGEWRVEWVQCCRVGFGTIVAHAPPVVRTPDGALGAFSSQQRFNDVPTQVPKDYAHQYRNKRSAVEKTAIHTGRHTILAEHELQNEGRVGDFAILKDIERQKRIEQAEIDALDLKSHVHAM